MFRTLPPLSVTTGFTKHYFRPNRKSQSFAKEMLWIAVTVEIGMDIPGAES